MTRGVISDSHNYLTVNVFINYLKLND